MLYFEKASDHRVLRYDSKGMYFVEMRNNEMNEIPISLIELRSNKDALLLQAIKRAERGESKIYAVSPIINIYTNEPEVTFYEVDDYNAVLTAFGLGNSGHRHHIVWQYSKSDTGKGYAQIDLTFKCGCVLHDDNKRTIQKELRDQHKIEFSINSVKWNNDSTTVAVDVRRSDLKDKPHDLQ